MIRKSMFVFAVAAGMFTTTNAFSQTTTDTTSKSSAGAGSSAGTAQGTSGSSAAASTSPSSTNTTSAASPVSSGAAGSSFIRLITMSGTDKNLQGDYTIFAPSNDAVTALGSLDTTAAGKEKVTAMVNSYIVKGKYTSKDLAKAISAGKGAAHFTSLSGNKLTLKVNADKNLEISDSNGNTALATSFDQTSPFGVVHVIDKTLAAQGNH